MNIQDIIAQSGGIGSIARELGVDEGTAQAGVGALLPAVLGGFKEQAQTQPQGLGGLLGMVQGMGWGGLLDSVLGAGPSNVAASKDVLGGIFGSKDNSRAVAADASAKSDVPTDLLKKMLPLVAMLVAGHMAKQGNAARCKPGWPWRDARLGAGRHERRAGRTVGRRPRRAGINA